MRKLSLTSLVLGTLLSVGGCAGPCKDIKDIGYVTHPYKVSTRSEEELVEKDGKFYLREKWRENVYQCERGRKIGKFNRKYTALRGVNELIREN
ncbi:hypothetical protein HYU23_00990 [Candidatus Woesearchaeota archaeon]|nr:hypothetical protein [Candidatus Woesearchaeota archaeon]